MGTWKHMAIGVPMVLSNGVAGITFSGGTASFLHFEKLILILAQLMSADSSVTLMWRCWCDGTKLAHSHHSSARMHTLMQNDGNLTC